MPIEHQEFLEVARGLLQASESEASLRSATSRAYYAAFHCARARADQCCPTVDRDQVSGGSHEQLIHRYIAAGTPQAKSIAYMLRDLKAKRVLSDYELARLVRATEAASNVETAARLIERIVALQPA